MKNKPVLLIDDQCTICNKTTRFVEKHGGKNKFEFVSLYSNEGKILLNQIGFPEDYNDSVVLIDGNKVFTKSDAALFTLKKLNGFFSFFYRLNIIPQKIRNAIYDFVAKHRHKFY